MDHPPFRHAPNGWNTSDFQGFNRLRYLDAGRPVVGIRYAIWDETVPPPTPESKQIGRLVDVFRWEDVTRLGPHAPLGLPATLDFKAGGVGYEAVAKDQRGMLELTVTPRAETAQRVLFLFDVPVGEAIERDGDERGRFAECQVTLRGATWPRDYFVSVAEPYAVGQPGAAAAVCITPPNVPAPEAAAPVKLAHAETTGSGALADVPELLLDTVAWNTLYDHRRRLVVSPVSRDWCQDWRGPIVFCWDTFLAGAMIAHASPALARLNFEAALAAVDELGFVPNYYMSHGAASRDRSMPPLGAWCIWKTQAVDPDRAWLAEIYPRLATWNRFWREHRSRGPRGLLSWGSNPVPYQFPQLLPYNGTLQHCRQAAVYESGMDNSPMYDDVEFDAERNCLALDDVALSCYYAMDCQALAAIARVIDRKEESYELAREHAEIGEAIDEHLWDEDAGIYANRHWDGRFSKRYSPTSFLPLTAGVADREHVERLVEEHLRNPDDFWGEFVLPSISRSDPAYADNDYWRGRIWPPLNFLVAEGLWSYAHNDLATELAKKSLALLMDNWRRDGGVYENYNAETGAGGDVPNAARLYHWGGLLGSVGMGALVGVESKGYLRFGSKQFPKARLDHVHLGRDTYSIELGKDLKVTRNKRPFLHLAPRGTVRLPIHGLPDIAVYVDAGKTGELTLHDPDRWPHKALLFDGRMIPARHTTEGLLFRW